MRSKLREEGGSGKPATTCNRRFELGVNPTRNGRTRTSVHARYTRGEFPKGGGGEDGVINPRSFFSV